MKPLEEMTLKELKDLCRSFGLSVEGHKGKKQSYIDALTEVEEAEESEPEQEEQEETYILPATVEIDDDDDEYDDYTPDPEFDDDDDDGLIPSGLPPETKETLKQFILHFDPRWEEEEEDSGLEPLSSPQEDEYEDELESFFEADELIPDEDSFKWERWIGVKESLVVDEEIHTSTVLRTQPIAIGSKIVLVDESLSKIQAIGEIKGIIVDDGRGTDINVSSVPRHYDWNWWKVKIEKIWDFENPLTIKPLDHVDTSGIFEVRLTDRSKSKFPQELAMCEYKKEMDKQYQVNNN